MCIYIFDNNVNFFKSLHWKKVYKMLCVVPVTWYVLIILSYVLRERQSCFYSLPPINRSLCSDSQLLSLLNDRFELPDHGLCPLNLISSINFYIVIRRRLQLLSDNALESHYTMAFKTLHSPMSC